MHAFGLGFHLEHALRVAVHHTWNMPYKQPLKIRAPSAGVRHRGDAAVRVVRWFSSFGMKCVSRISRCARSGRGRQPREVRGLGVIHAQAGRSTEAEDMIIRPNLIFFFGESAQEWTLTKNWVSAHARPSTKSRLHSVSGLGSATLTRFVQLLPVSAAQHKSKSCESLVIELLQRTHARCKPARTHAARTIASMHTHTHT